MQLLTPRHECLDNMMKMDVILDPEDARLTGPIKKAQGKFRLDCIVGLGALVKAHAIIAFHRYVWTTTLL